MNKRGYETTALMAFYLLLAVIVIFLILAWRIYDVVGYNSNALDQNFKKLDVELSDYAVKASPYKIKFEEYLGEKIDKSNS